MNGPRRLDDLPSFEQKRADGFRRLGNAYDALRSDCAPGRGPTARQAAALGRALRAITEAKAALDEAVRR